MSHIFISYNQKDADFAAVMMMTLEKAGFDTWIDKNRLRPGADWSEEIDSGILSAVAMVLIISPDSKTSEYVTYEWSFGLGAGIPIVPVLHKDTDIHPRLRRLQYLDFRGNVRPWDKLQEELESILSVRPTRWSPPRNTPPHLKRTIQDLDSGNSATRHGAIEILVESDNKIAREALRNALIHPFRDIRARATIELGMLKDEIILTDSGITALKDALVYPSNDIKDNTRRRARIAIVHIGKPAYKILAKTSKDLTDPARISALSLLGKVGGEDAIPLLIEHTNDTNKEIATNSVKQLGNLKAKQAIDILVRGVLEQPFPNKHEDGFTHNWNENYESEAVRTLIRIGDISIIPIFIEALEHKNPLVRMSSAQILRYLGDSSVINVIAKLLNDTERAYYIINRESGDYGDKYTVHEFAAMMLDEMGTPEAINLLRKYRREHPYKDKWNKLSIDNDKNKEA